MAIDYVTDVRSLYAGDVLADADYGIEPTATCPDCKVELGRANEVSEQDILTTLAVVEAHVRLLRDRDEARILHYALARLLKGIGSGGFVFEDLGIDVAGSKVNPVFAPTDDIELLDETGTPIVGTPVAVGGTGTLADAVAAINGVAAVGTAGIVASGVNGRLTLTQDDGSLAASANRRYAPGFAIGVGGANNNVARLAGLEIAVHKNRLDELADRLRDDALDFFQKEQREETLDDYFRRDPQRA